MDEELEGQGADGVNDGELEGVDIELTDDDLDVIAGKRDQLLGKIQERHGVTLEEAEKQVTAWHQSNPTNFFERY